MNKNLMMLLIVMGGSYLGVVWLPTLLPFGPGK